MMAIETTTSCLRGAGIERSCPTATLVILARHIVVLFRNCRSCPLLHHKMRHVAVGVREDAALETSSRTSSSC